MSTRHMAWFFVFSSSSGPVVVFCFNVVVSMVLCLCLCCVFQMLLPLIFLLTTKEKKRLHQTGLFTPEWLLWSNPHPLSMRSPQSHPAEPTTLPVPDCV